MMQLWLIKMKNKLIIFDIDDTLYDEIDYVKSGYKIVAQKLAKKYKIDDAYEKMMSLFSSSSKNVFNRLFDSLNIKYSDDDILELVNLYRNHHPNIKLSNDVINTLTYLRKKYSLAIISDGNYNSQLLKVKSLGLEKLFDEILLTDKYGADYWKPSKLAFVHLSKKMNIKLTDMYYVGDNPKKDFYISKYGIKTIRYYNKNGVYYNEKYLENIEENYKISNLSEIISIVE